MFHRIALIGIFNSNNLGDALLSNCTKKLITEYMYNREQSFVVDAIELLPKEVKVSKSAGKLKSLGLNNNKICSTGKIRRILARIWLKANRNYSLHYEYYSNKLRNYDCVVFVGGGLIKFDQQEKISSNIATIVSLCEKSQKPVFFHSVGVEGFDFEHKGCQSLFKSLNSECVKFVSTRDDIEILRNDYLSEKKSVTMKAADSAVYTSDIFNIAKKSDSDYVGVGVVRGEIFSNYGIKVSSTEVMDYYIGILRNLDSKRIKWKLFCNGFLPDYLFGLDLLKKMNRNPQKIISRAKNYQELVEQISEFKLIVAARLHACIISYSMKIPFIALKWNEKLSFFCQDIGYPDWVIDITESLPAEITNKLQSMWNLEYQEEKISRYKLSSKNSISIICESIIKNQL